MSQETYPKRLRRRDFLKLAAITAGVAALPVSYELLTSTEDRAQAAAAQAQTDTYNGWRGQNFSSGWRFNRGDVSGAQNPSYNDSGWRSLNVPHDWSIELAFNQGSPAGSGGGYLDGGVGWYRKTFTVPADYSGRKVFIGFDGVYMNSQVWINGTSVGTRPYGYISFEYDISQYLNYGGSNVIAVRVNNNQPTSRWYSGSGIYRHVWLTVLNPTHVDYCGMFVTTPNVSSSSATVNVSSRVRNQSSTTQAVTLITTILDANGNTVATNTSSAVNVNAGATNTVSQNLTVSNPRLWSTTSPNLYTARTQVSIGGSVVDTYQSSLGIRTFAFDANNGFSLNGVSMKLNGVCNHHDLGALGAAVNYRAVERQLQILKAMGCNALRTSHNPPDPMVLDVCDRLGILVMDEAFDCWETGKTNNDYHLYFNSWARTDIQALVMRDRNHPSVIIWSLGNEIFSATLATATNLRNWVREIDTTRPCTCGSNDTYNGLTTDILNILDLVGYNYNPGIYDARHSSFPNWKIFGSETSSAVRSRGIYKTPTNQNILTGSDNQCSSYDNSVVSWGNSAESSYTAINSRRFIAGEFIWTGFDYIGEPTPYGWPAKSSYFGIIDTCGFPKDIYYFYQSRWTTTPMVHILPHWNWSSGQTIPVWVYSNCDSVELFLNNVSLGTRSISGSTLHLTWDVPFSSGTLRAEGRRGGSVVATKEMRTAGSASRLALSVDRSRIGADGEDLAFVTVDVVDANGVLVPNATNTVNFSISGPGVIVGVDNGNAPSTESYKGSTRRAFSGKCLAIVQSTGAAGTITLTASSSGLSSGSVNITAEGGIIATDTPTPTGTLPPNNNLALGKPATASSAETSNPVANGNDGNSATRWCAANGNTGAWWQVDLGASYSLSGSEVVWEFDGRNYRYRVEVSGNGSTWTTVVDKTNTTGTAQTQTDPFTATGRYVRITVTGLPASTWASFFEFRVFGSTVTITPPVTTPPPTTPPVTTPPPGTVSINAGGSATGSFGADQYFSGGSTYTNTATIDMSQIPTNPPPAAIFNTERYGAMTYTIPNRSGAQTVTLYFSENFVTAGGQRLFNVSINGTTVLSNFDIYVSAGGQNRAIARTFNVTPDASGQVVIQFTAVTENPKISAITVANSGPTPTTPPATTPPATTPPPTTPPVTTPPPSAVSINAGGSATGSFEADQYFSGGSTYTNTATIDMSQIPTNPPPAAVFNTERYGAMTYTIPNLTAGRSYTVTLYFAETFLTAAGQRLFNVSVNGTTVLSNFDLYASAGGANRAIARSFTATANSSGQVVIQFTAVTENPKINAITVAG